MKRFLVALLLVVMVMPCVFADDEVKEEAAPVVEEPVAEEPVAEEHVVEVEAPAVEVPSEKGDKWEIIDSIGLQVAFEHVSMMGKFNSDDVKTNKMSGVGIGLVAELDLSEIPHFLKPGWFAYFDFDLMFSKKITFRDVKYTDEEMSKILGIRSHLCVLRALNLKLPFQTRVGAGVGFNRIAASASEERHSATAWSFAIVGEGVLTIGKHLGISLVADLDLSFVTNAQAKQRMANGAVTFTRHTSGGFGLDLAVKAGIKYVI